MMKTFLTIITFLTLPLLGSSQTLCSKYTTALFVNNTADDQLELISTLVNLAVLGDETLDVDGILAPGGNLASFFDGSTATANRGGVATAVNFLDGAPDLPTPSMTSNTYILLVHLYQFFGALIGCDAEGFPAYQGVADMYEVHKFMFLNTAQNDYFIGQVGAAALALGVSEEDATAVGGILDSVFNRRCTPALTAEDGVPSFLVGTNPSVCIAETCVTADESACPEMPTMTAGPTASMTGSPTGAPISSSSIKSFAPFPLIVLGAALSWF